MIVKKAILIQIRKDKNIAVQEYKSFLNIAERANVDLEAINVYYQDLNLEKIIKNYSFILVGGSDISVKDDFPQKQKIAEVIKIAVKNKKPFLGICFGFQLIIEFLGGKVIRDKKKAEFGTKKIIIEKSSIKDKIFSDISRVFDAQEVHNWSVVKKPSNSTIIAMGNNIIQGIKINNTPVYGFQFHAELTRGDMLERMNYYNKLEDVAYSFSQSDFKKVFSSKKSENIILNFFKYF